MFLIHLLEYFRLVRSLVKLIYLKRMIKSYFSGCNRIQSNYSVTAKVLLGLRIFIPEHYALRGISIAQ